MAANCEPVPAEAGRFMWYELMTTDPKAAGTFYREVIGWDARPASVPGVDYTLVSAGGIDVGGMMALPAEARRGGAQPGWIGYLAVADVDGKVERIEAAGGSTHVPPSTLPGVGRFAMVADPQGAVFALIAPEGPPPGAAPPVDTPGLAGWRELHTDDWQGAFAFYASQFGWTRGESVDIGPMGTYQLFNAGDRSIGGMMNRTADSPPPFWLFYFNVTGIDAAAARVTAAGGRVLHGPHEVPGGARVVQCADPQGAMFALVSMP